MKNYRKKIYEIIPKLRALDGQRDNVALLEPCNIDIGGDN